MISTMRSIIVWLSACRAVAQATECKAADETTMLQGLASVARHHQQKRMNATDANSLDAKGLVKSQYPDYHFGTPAANICETSAVSEADCLAAAQHLLPNGAVQRRTHLVTGSWGWVPPGCSSLGAPSWDAHYNRNSGGNNDGGYTPVCERLPVPDYHFGTPAANLCETSAVSEADCLAAVHHILPNGAVQSRTNLLTGSWGWVPPGCSAYPPTYDAHYNRKSGGNNNGVYLPVCERLPVPDYHFGTPAANTCETSAVSEADCLAAVHHLLPNGAVQTRTHLVTGSWGWVPPGCSTYPSTYPAHYNRNSGAQNTGSYTPVCKRFNNPQNHCPMVDTSGEWTLTVGASGAAQGANSDVGAACFNELFQACPVVRYTNPNRGGTGSGVYVRHGASYAGDAHDLFTHFWVQNDNRHHTDFEIYPTIQDARAGSNAWTFCNFLDDADVGTFVYGGFPRDCGPTGFQPLIWYTNQVYSWYPNGNVGYFEAYTGADCPLPVLSYTVSGRIRNAVQPTQGVSSATLVIDGQTITVNAQGYYTITLPAGDHSYTLNAHGFITIPSRSLTVTAAATVNINMSPELAADSWRIVLSWEEYPRDLDSYLFFLGEESECPSMSYTNKRASCAGVTATLDVDDTSSFGPETTTLSDVNSCSPSERQCKWVYKVENYSGRSDQVHGWQHSDATVVLYNGDHLVRDFRVNADHGYKLDDGVGSREYWSVFSVDAYGNVEECSNANCD